MNELEQECIVLNSAWDMINGMVNWAMFDEIDLCLTTVPVKSSAGKLASLQRA